MWTISDKQMAAIAKTMDETAKKIADKVTEKKTNAKVVSKTSSNTSGGVSSVSNSGTTSSSATNYPRVNTNISSTKTASPVMECEKNEVVSVSFLKVPQVEKIKLKSNLEDGFYGKGMVYGKTYELEVESFIANRKPGNEKDIRWELGYTDDDGSIVIMALKEKGKKIKFKVDDLELLGKDVTFFAYIGEEKETGGKKSVLIHNRFRWFDKNTFATELNIRKNKPSELYQHATPLCGVVSMMYHFSHDYPDLFYNTFLEFFRTGDCMLNQYKLKPDKSLYEMKPLPTNSNYPRYTKYSNGNPINPPNTMQQADWIVLAGTRSSENNSYEGLDGEDFDGINWPSYMEKMAKQLYNIKEVINITSFNPPFFRGDAYIKSVKDAFRDIDLLFKNDYRIILLIDSDMLNNAKSFWAGPTHWIPFLGEFNLDEVKDQYTFKYYSWQKEELKTFDAKAVESNIYGYIAFRKRTFIDSPMDQHKHGFDIVIDDNKPLMV